MGTSYVSFDEGTTRKVRTFQRTDGADTVEEWMYAESEPPLDAYVANTGSIAGATADSHLLQLMAGASNRIGVRKIEIFQHTAANTTQRVIFGVFRLSTAGTGGGALTELPLDPSSPSVEAAGMSLPSSKGTEAGQLGMYKTAVIQDTLTNLTNAPLASWDFTLDRTRGLWIAAGTSNGICVKNLTADSAVDYYLGITWVEADWA